MRRREPRGVARPVRPEARRVRLVIAIVVRVVVAVVAAVTLGEETADRVRLGEIATIEIGRRVRR